MNSILNSKHLFFNLSTKSLKFRNIILSSRKPFLCSNYIFVLITFINVLFLPSISYTINEATSSVCLAYFFLSLSGYRVPLGGLWFFIACLFCVLSILVLVSLLGVPSTMAEQGAGTGQCQFWWAGGQPASKLTFSQGAYWIFSQQNRRRPIQSN